MSDLLKNSPDDKTKKDEADEKVRTRRGRIEQLELDEAEAELREFKKYGSREIS